ncbi:hypothetical protein ACFV5N_00745 [Streptomyces sp. NPDC059853]|uniref:hypothetical protein n=1 Tax=Streptomyces sp. NPDC059853 TaxID=3346973 RepID=UPI00364BCB0A
MHTPPAARRRHAQLIAAATRLIAGCAQAASEIYDPIARNPGQDVEVNARELLLLASGAPAILDHARNADCERWPEETAVEDRNTFRAHAERAVLAEAAAVLDTEPAGEPVAWPAGVPEITPEHDAAMAPIAAAEELMADITAERVQLLAHAHDAHPSEIVAEAITQASGSACLALAQAEDILTSDPSAAAEMALTATRYLADLVSVASLDV